jgi:hypothetical protein
MVEAVSMMMMHFVICRSIIYYSLMVPPNQSEFHYRFNCVSILIVIDGKLVNQLQLNAMLLDILFQLKCEYLI